MAVTKRIMVTLPEQLLAELDRLVCETSGNRSQFVQEAMRTYLQAKQKRHLYEALKHGYMDMAEINLALARENLALENEALEKTRAAGGVS